MSHSIAALVLGLPTAYEGEHAAFGLLILTNFTLDDVLQFHPLPVNDKISFFLWLTKSPLYINITFS
jgi:hypothetical protein